jgi:type IV pilus assembly protein PilM
MNINILNGARSIFARDASAGGSHYTGLLQKELGISFEQAEAVKRGMALPDGVEAKPIQPIIETVSETLALEVKKTFDFYRTTAQESEATIQKILLAGGGSKLPGLPDFLAARFDIPVEVFDPFRQIEVDATKFDPDYMREIVPEMAVAVGLALRGVDA